MGVASIDQITARNNTGVTILFGGKRVGRIQQMRASQNNNVQVLAELGRQYMVEMKKGITAYSFSVSTFLVRADVMQPLKDGKVFSLTIRDENNIDVEGTGAAEVIDTFSRCMIASLDRDYTVGQAAIGQSATIQVVGQSGT